MQNDNPFTDVTESTWYHDVVLWVAIVGGTPMDGLMETIRSQESSLPPFCGAVQAVRRLTAPPIFPTRSRLHSSNSFCNLIGIRKFLLGVEL